MRAPWTGAGTALITPFTKSGDVDEAAVRRLGRRQVDAGIHFISPCGTTGENPTLSKAERLRIVEILADEVGGTVQILAGCGGYNTKEVVHLAKAMHKAGADGLLSVTPYYNKPTQEGIVQHFTAIADATPLPIVLYNIAGRTGVNIETATVARLAQVHHHRREGSVGQPVADVRRAQRAAIRLHRAVRRRCADAAADGGGRPRGDLGRVE